MLTASLLFTALLPQTRDTLPPDSLRIARLPALEVTLARRRDQIDRLPQSATVVTVDALRRAQPTFGLDEALSQVPGVIAANRWNYSLDQRLSIRGFGSRANFGIRGIKVLLDGVPQTLPDGQSQLTNVDFGALSRVEILRGAASARYGNASGGVLAFTSEAPPEEDVTARTRVEAGSFGTTKWLARVTGRKGAVAGGLLASRFSTDGFRQQSAAAIRHVAADLHWNPAQATRVALRGAWNDTPRAENPGALTPAEYAVRPDSAAGNNILRGADKQVSQWQASLLVTHAPHSGVHWSVMVHGLGRDLDNPLATPPPGPPSPTAGTYNTIDRQAGGVRLQADLPLSPALLASAGFDAQRMRDHRRNVRSDGGAPTTTLLAEQQETVTEAGPFVQARWTATSALTIDGGIRWDRITFDVDDRYLGDGLDNSGTRRMAALSGNVGAAWRVSQTANLYGTWSTAFETPTSTELVNTSAGGIGFNAALGPQRATSVELGVRTSGTRASASLALFRVGVRDAIVQVREQDGRAFFANVGRTENRGVEAGGAFVLGPGLMLQGTWTWADYIFREYRVPNGQTTDTLDGRRLAGIPRHTARLTATATPVAGLSLTWEQAFSASLYGDDRNTLDVAGWGLGVASLRAAWTARAGGLVLEPFAGIFNLFDRRYVGSVTINGFGGRVLEPAAGRWVLVGLGIDWRRR